MRALASSQDELEKREDDALGAPVQVRVVLDGPYGGLGYSGLGEAEMVVCVAGGSGVSFLLGVAEEAREAMAQGKLRVVRLVWATKNYGTFSSRSTCDSSRFLFYSRASQPPSLLFSRSLRHFSRPISRSPST